MRFAPLFLPLVFLASCGGDQARPEVIDKLRALGVATNPLVVELGAVPKTVELTVYAALPPGGVVTTSAFKDEKAKLGFTLPEAAIVVDPATAKVTEYQGVAVYEVKATVTVPPAAQLLRGGRAGAPIRYGFRLVSGAEEELIIGTFLGYGAGAPELAWTAPTTQILVPEAPAKVAADTKVDLTATVNDPNDEVLKVGWYASGGEIENRAARRTTWKTPEKGAHTLIMTVRGKESKGFSLHVLPVGVE